MVVVSEAEIKKHPRQSTTEQFILKMENKFPNELTYEKTVYNGNKNEVTVTCKLHGDITCLAGSFKFKVHGCGKCENQKRYNHAMRQAREKYGDKFDYSEVIWVNQSTPVTIICPIHGKFRKTLSDHIRRNCEKCSFKARTTSTEYFIKKAKIIFGDKYDYTYTEYVGPRVAVSIECPRHGVFKQRPSSHLCGNGCLKCHLEDKVKPVNQFISDAKEIHGEKFDYSKVIYRGNKKPVTLVCKRHGDFKIKPNAHLSNRSGCPRCRNSKGENMISAFLRKNHIPHIQEYKFDGSQYRYDFYIPMTNQLIEFHGMQHYKPVERFGGIKALAIVRIRDKKKVELAKIKGCNLVVLNYRDMDHKRLYKKLVAALKFAYPHWYLINGDLKVFKSLMGLLDYYAIPNTLQLRDFEKYILENYTNFQVLLLPPTQSRNPR